MDKLAVFLFLFLCLGLTAQEPMRVTRSAAVDRNSPINNIYIDAENNKWVGNSLGVFQVHTVDYASPIEKEEGQSSLLRYPGGNYQLLWNKEALFNQMREETDGLFEGDIDITSMFYDDSNKELWIGTRGIGIFRFNMSGTGELIENMSMDNSKLRTDMINTMLIDRPGSYWIATEEGVLHNSGRKWKVYEQYVNIEALAVSMDGVWVFGEGYLWKVDAAGDWEEIELKESFSEGKIRDIAFDSRGRMWIASEIITRYNPELGSIEKFGAAEYFTSDFPSALAVDQDDAIWVGTEDKGLYLIEKATAMSISCILDKAPSCDGQNDAELKVIVSGGIEPYTFKWNENLNGKNPKGVAPGKYVVTVTDNKGKSKTAEVQINDPAITVSVQQTQPESSPGAADGAASATVTGGQGNYLYKWENSSTESTAKNLTSGEYSLTVTDEGGCSTVAKVNISQEAAPLNISIEQTQAVTCVGTATASLKVNLSGGRGPYEYNWSNQTLTGETPENIAAGDYKLTITDSEGTSANASITIEDAASFTANILIDAPASTGNADGKATVKTTGGTAPFAFAWDNGESTATATKLAPGERSVTVTDANGCTTTSTISIDENILPLSVSIEQNGTIKCPGQAEAAISAQVRGGKGPFTFAWSDSNLSGDTPQNLAAGNYTLTITDSEGTSADASITIEEPKTLVANIIIDAPASTDNTDGKATVKIEGGTTAPFAFQWDNGESTATATKLAPGERSVTVTDANGCTTTGTVSIDENILPLSVSIEQTGTIKCPGQAEAAISAQVRGGKGPFTFAWSDSNLSGEAPQNLAVGSYNLTITDSEGTSANASIAIEEPKTLVANIIVDAPASTDNVDGKATAKVEGGTAPYTFQWDNSESTATATKLAPGERSVTVTDANECTTTGTVSIDENILPLSVSIEQTEAIKCQGQSISITTTVQGGKGPFQFSWNNEQLSGESPSSVSAGSYEVSVTDALGTVAAATININEPTALSAAIVKNGRVSTPDSQDGLAKVEANGGTPPYSFKWDNGETEDITKTLAIGNHSVTATDANGCSTNLSFETKKMILPELNLAKLRTGQNIRMEELFFEADSFRITPQSIPVLDEVYDFLSDNSEVVIEVGGHTNNIPETAFCDYLSEERAKSVANYIVRKGIDPQRVFYKGYGKRDPIASNRTAEGRARNQRVEIKILKF
jgi:outer membrane protein OmpA-like peptidoglycan-associated protein